MAEHWPRSRWTNYPLRAGTIGRQQYLFVHHTVSHCSGDFGHCLRDTEAMHINSRGMVNIAYNVLSPNGGGVIADGRGFGRSGGHTLNWNSRANAVCAYGNYENDAPGDRLVEAIADAIILGIRQGYISSNPIIGGHRDVFPTACPGRHLYARLPAIRDLVARGGAPAPTPKPPSEIPKGVTMFLWQDTNKACWHFVGTPGVDGDAKLIKATDYLQLASVLPHRENVDAGTVNRVARYFQDGKFPS